MKIINKILTKLNTIYLNKLYKSINIERNSLLDYRIEIDNKSNITIGKNSILYKNSTVYKKNNGKFILGNNSHIAPYSYFLIDDFTIIIGDNVAIAKNCSFFNITNSMPENDNILYKDSYEKGDILLNNNIFIGTNCVLLPNTIIEDNVVVASNSTVKGRLENGWLYGGNPVKKIRKVNDR